MALLAAKTQALLQPAVAAALSAALAPVRIWTRLASFWAGLLLQTLAWLGAPPTGFVPVSKLRELSTVVDHMSRREESYRQVRGRRAGRKHRAAATVHRLLAMQHNRLEWNQCDCCECVLQRHLRTPGRHGLVKSPSPPVCCAGAERDARSARLHRGVACQLINCRGRCAVRNQFAAMHAAHGLQYHCWATDFQLITHTSREVCCTSHQLQPPNS